MGEKKIMKLHELVNSLGVMDDEWYHYWNSETGKFDFYHPTYCDESMDTEEFQGPEYHSLPKSYELGEYNLMVAFAENEVADPDTQYVLSIALRGRGAFRRFKDVVIDHDLEEAWYAYRYAAFAKIARRWCENHGIAYEE